MINSWPAVLSLYHYEQKVFMDHSSFYVPGDDWADHCTVILDW